jgi:hypothetical protein
MIAAAMAARLPPGRELQSWKEIAAYLGVTERTAQNWERERGLPVHRLGGEKGRVVAWTEELDRWRAAALDRPSWWSSIRFWRACSVAAGLVVLAGAVAGALLEWGRMRRGPPTRFTLDERSLIVTDDHGREVWRHLFKEPFARGLTAVDLLHLRLAAFADLDRDGHNEFLLVHRPASYLTQGDTLICFSDRGRPLWSYRVTKTVSTAAEVFGPPHLGGFLLVQPPGRDGTRRVAYASHHFSYFPAQLDLLTHRGELRAEYWHSGHLLFGENAVLEEPKRPAILLAAISNSYRTASLIALNPDSMGCASDESEHPAYQLSVPGRNCELARIVFPRTCISRAFDPYSKPTGLVVHPASVFAGRRALPAGDSYPAALAAALRPAGREPPLRGPAKMSRRCIASAGRKNSERFPKQLSLPFCAMLQEEEGDVPRFSFAPAADVARAAGPGAGGSVPPSLGRGCVLPF